MEKDTSNFFLYLIAAVVAFYTSCSVSVPWSRLIPLELELLKSK